MKYEICIVSFLTACAPGQVRTAVPFDGSGVRPGPVYVTSTAQSATVHWSDEANRRWTAEFSLDPKAPLITAIAVNDAVDQRTRPNRRGASPWCTDKRDDRGRSQPHH